MAQQFQPTTKKPVFSVTIRNNDPKIHVERYFGEYGGDTRFGVLLETKDPLDTTEMIEWLDNNHIPTFVKRCRYGINHPSGIIVYDNTVMQVDGKDYLYKVQVNFVANPDMPTGINYPEAVIEGFEYV